MTMPGMMAGMQGMQGMDGGMMKQALISGQGMMQMDQQVIIGLDLLDAGLAKIEALLERMLQR